ncbi:MAG: prepilin-type N-terminal cleavage/methylation domain-containing protein [Lentisphaerae bacterium]|nr:prepilin-type N-terminal cleavage/methylation domain-containing protein [Lentisphaerota bacterium]
MTGYTDMRRTGAAAAADPRPAAGPASPLPTPGSRISVPAPRRRRRAFTLVELLVVVGIMGLLLGVTVTAFDSIGKGAKMRSALMQIKSSLSLARQYAITDRRATYIIFPDQYRDDWKKDVPNPADYGYIEEARYQSYYIMNQDSLEDKDLSTEGRKYYRRVQYRLGRWQHLPKGVIFDRESRPQDLEFSPPPYDDLIVFANIFHRPLAQESQLSNNVFVLPFPGLTNTSMTCTQSVVALGFSANGRLIQNVPSVRWTPMMILSEGVVDTGADGVEKRYFMQPGSSKFSIEILPLTGRIKIREIYAK